jgi:hypothetical protein
MQIKIISEFGREMFSTSLILTEFGLVRGSWYSPFTQKQNRHTHTHTEQQKIFFFQGKSNTERKKKLFSFRFYHTRQTVSGFMGVPFLHWKASWNLSRFDVAPMARNRGSEWGLVVVKYRM